MFSKRFTSFFIIVLLAVLVISGAFYIYKKKYNKIPTIIPSSENIPDFNTKDSYLNKKNIIFVDFENYDKKEELDDTQAHSGKYSYKVFGKNSFSAVVARKVEEIGKENFIRIGFSAFVYVLNENFDQLKADLVFSIVDNKENNIVWKGVTMNNIFMKPNKWTKITGAFDVDINTIPDDGIIKTYLWNDSKTKILIDDILVVVGKDQTYRGDTTYCDNSIENGWARQFNYPPFPWEYLIKEPIDNQNSEFLIKNKSASAGKIYPHTNIVTGNFYNIQNQKDKIIAVEDNTLNAYSYCEQNKAFSQDFTMPLDSKNELWQSSGILSGKFLGQANDEIFLFDTASKKINLVAVIESNNYCTSKPAQMKLNMLWQGTFDDFKYDNKDLPLFFSAPYIINNQKVQLFCVYPNGNWQLFEYQNKAWSALAQSKKPLKEWDATNYDYNLTSGKFLSKTNSNVLLSVSTNKKSKQSAYSLSKFDKESKTFIEIISSQKSKVFGIDTLKASDYLFALKDNITRMSLMRYNTDWRYDLKHIAFSDSTYQILSTIDFKAYPNDFNPKYYEIVRLIPGCFLDKDKTSIMTICYNHKNKNIKNSQKDQYINHSFLPNALYVFTLKNE